MKSAGLPNQSALHVITEVDGYRVLNNKWILGKDDKVLATSNLTMPQLRAELKVRKLSTDGKRDDLKKRVMVQCCHLCCARAFAAYEHTGTCKV